MKKEADARRPHPSGVSPRPPRPSGVSPRPPRPSGVSPRPPRPSGVSPRPRPSRPEFVRLVCFVIIYYLYSYNPIASCCMLWSQLRNPH